MISDCGMRIANFKKYTCFAGQLCASALLLVLVLAGCAEKGPILLDVGYQAPAEKAGTLSTISVGVSPFRDGRGEPASVLGKRTIPSGMQNELVVSGTVAETATAIMKKALAARGIAVKDVVGWDLTAEGMKDGEGTLLLGGELKTLWLESKAVSMQTHLKVSVQIKITIGDRLEKKIIRTIDVNSKLEEDILYSRERLEAALSEALSSAVDQIFQDDDLKKRLL